MAKVKVNFSLWTDSPEFVKIGFSYQCRLIGWTKTTSEHGRSKGTATCPCCRHVSTIYIWSFIGSGKRCEYCKVLLTYGGAILSDGEITDEFFKHAKIKQNG